ncbi:RsmD family RNA methyltransferase [Bacteroides caecigallinarum]|uniref:RsmD family RNA methyltransferase n=1 Tax=Bacteroides caecigallinarum TaxID=1411144 RepID=UPI001F48CED2|nr:RsmD family RNA methyltransferase [Bacteroides caecigallinarum]MCF2594232.1 RsmD family RNA methyltransferase [Bacteroides caecigallinarum]
MRVISGIYKRRRFDVPHTFKARPTTDFAKENLFNVLNNYIDFEGGITALDLFAGTGSISIELVSRGCDKVISIEKDPQHFSFINKIMKEVKTDKCFVLRGDVFRYIERCNEKFDFIFADPPYALERLSEIPDLIFNHKLLKEDGLFVLEHGKDLSFESHPNFIEHRYYGSVNFSFFGYKSGEENSTEEEKTNE